MNSFKTTLRRLSNLNLDPVLILTGVLLFAGALTYFIDSGSFQRDGKKIIPDSYTVLDKDVGLANLVGIQSANNEAHPVSMLDIFVSIPQAINKQSGMIFMVLFIGGMFGVLKKSGAIEKGLERMLSLTKGNIYILIPIIMIIFSTGSTFIGMAKEYLIVVPMVVALANRLGLSNVIGLAIVAIPVKVGYLASITNPFALSIAQPLVGVPIFSGMEMRIMVYAVLLVVGISYVLYTIKKSTNSNFSEIAAFSEEKLSLRTILVLMTLGLGIAFLVYASQAWNWKYDQLSAYYLFLAIVFACIAKISPTETVDAFIDGMKKVLIAGVLISLATAVAIILEKGNVLDSIVYYLSNAVGKDNPTLSAYGMFFAQLMIDVVIPSTSGQAAVTMPILAPLGQLSGVDPHTTVLAFLMGNGATNIITPTSSGLLILLAAAQVGWGQWAKYILPFFLMVIAFALVFLTISLKYYA
ncbi:YfcC family protein [Marinomonas polaris]|uniref:YfcC family protein n=1 Tax=Marinomonas polaris TaxID=293552 RepID=UPI0035162B27